MIKETMVRVESVTSSLDKFNERLIKEEKAMIESKVAIETLTEQTQTLFKRTLENSQRINSIESAINEKLTSLTHEVSEVSIRLQASTQSSKSDLTRMDKMLQQLMTDLSAEITAREIGDTKAASATLAQVNTLLSEIKKEMKSHTTVT